MSADLATLLQRARARIRRYEPLEAACVNGRGGLMVDMRPLEQRRRDGVIPGALIIDRNVLEWRLEPGGAHRIAELRGAGQEVVLVCNQGYSSSLAAAALVDIGLVHAGDVIGGFQAWLAAGLPVSAAPDGGAAIA